MLKELLDRYFETLKDVLTIILDILWAIFEMLKFVVFVAVHIGIIYLIYIGIRSIF